MPTVLKTETVEYLKKNNSTYVRALIDIQHGIKRKSYCLLFGITVMLSVVKSCNITRGFLPEIVKWKSQKYMYVSHIFLKAYQVNFP